ncbi:MAG: hypothetical protein Q8L98_02965 [Chlamydiales bacterium]|nr:hypothetical protein [Chlamydiales bacterium]
MRAWLAVIIPFTCIAQIEPEEEALSLRRIADFWQEGEYLLVKNQIEGYLTKYPDSAYYDTLCAALGDLCLREKNYSTALDYYSRILDPEWQNTVFLNRMQCLYYLEWYTTLADECEEFLAKNEHTTAAPQATYYLAIALYQQCLNAENDPELLETIALRAKPHFATLLENGRSTEVSQALAYLCCTLKEFPQASDIYLQLAEQDEERKEQLLFQAAVLQSSFDKEKATSTFKKVADLGQNKAQDAAFNYLVLHFEMKHYDLILQEKQDLLTKIVSSQQPNAHLLFGQSHFHLKEYSEAMKELTFFVDSALSYETRRPGMIYLLAAAFKENDLAAFERTIAQLDPQDSEQPQALFAFSSLLKQQGHKEKATDRLAYLLDTYPEFPEKPKALFELTDLEYQNRHWKSCRSHAQWFVAEYPSHELTPKAWHYLISSSTQLSEQEMLGQHTLKKQLTSDLEILLTYADLFTKEEICDWQFLLAKTYYELHEHQKAFELVEALMQHPSFPEIANTYLLMALLQKDESAELFCYYAEEALSLGANLVDTTQLHIALFNGYLESSEKQPELIEKAAHHLFIAFSAKGTLQPENLDWLANYYYTRAEKEDIATLRAIQLFEKCSKTASNTYKLAKLYSLTLQIDKQVALLEETKESLGPEAKYLLAEGYKHLGKKEEAIALFDAIVTESSTLRNPTGAAASLESVRLKQEKGTISCQDAATCLKNLMIQRRLTNEPVHLEAAIEYIVLQSEGNPAKRLALLQKTKADFETTDDLLSKDYHEARQKIPEKDHIYKMYMYFFEADISLCEYLLTKEPSLREQLKNTTETLFLRIKKDPIGDALLGDRVNEKLQLVQAHLREHESDV